MEIMLQNHRWTKTSRSKPCKTNFLRKWSKIAWSSLLTHPAQTFEFYQKEKPGVSWISLTALLLVNSWTKSDRFSMCRLYFKIWVIYSRRHSPRLKNYTYTIAVFVCVCVCVFYEEGAPEVLPRRWGKSVYQNCLSTFWNPSFQERMCGSSINSRSVTGWSQHSHNNIY